MHMSYIQPKTLMAQGAKKLASDESERERYRREMAERIYTAFQEYNRGIPRSGQITQADLGRFVADKLGRAQPFTQANVSRWMSETDPGQPDNPTVKAIAEVLNVDLMWLLYGAREG